MSIAVVHSNTAEGRAALVYAAKEADLRRKRLLVLYVFDGDEGPASEADLSALRAEVQQLLHNGGVGDATWELRTAVEPGDGAGGLVTLTQRVGPELLVIGSRRRSVGKLLIASAVQRMVLDSPVPVLVVKAPAD